VRLLLAFALLGLGCETPCALVCANDTECVQQGVLPGFYCLNNTVCLQDCFRCGGQCVDTFSNCGACGHACAAGQRCSQGACTSGACPAGFNDCSGSCYDLSNDRVHCGACGNACARDQICVSNACTNSICG